MRSTSPYSPQISKDVVYNIISSDSPLYLSEYMPANLLLKYEDKQVILNESTLLGRLEKLLTLLRQECQVLEIEARSGRQGQCPDGQGSAGILPA